MMDIQAPVLCFGPFCIHWSTRFSNPLEKQSRFSICNWKTNGPNITPTPCYVTTTEENSFAQVNSFIRKCRFGGDI